MERGKHVAPRPAGNDPDALPPVFSLEYLDSGAYCLSRCDQSAKAAFADTIHKLSALTWKTIRLSGRHASGAEKIPRSQIRGAMPSHITDDRTFFLAFRFQGMAPMVGYREGRIFYVLWLDPGFTLYDHG